MKTIEEIKAAKKILIGQVSSDGFYGEIHLPTWTGSIICSWGGGWEHVSVAPYKHRITPSWDDMCAVKDMIFNDNEWVVQFHPGKDEYVSNMPNCLHLWRPIDKELVTPPSCLVGIRKGQSKESLMNELKDFDLI